MFARLIVGAFAFQLASAGDFFAQLEPDRTLHRVGNWQISSARFGIGCVAQVEYSPNHHLSLSGENSRALSLLITVDQRLFNTKVDGSQEGELDDIEIALKDRRWGGVEGYGYRGTPGVVLKLKPDFLRSFANSKAMKVTERGAEKLRIDLARPRDVVSSLTACFQRE